MTFDASSFTDPDSKITGYDWDFDGDGTVDRSTDTPTTEFAYGDAGSFTAKVAAKDFRGGAGEATAAVDGDRLSRPPAAGGGGGAVAVAAASRRSARRTSGCPPPARAARSRSA